ncbi:hypothetical protein CUMW_176450 [Citrus unshiu]|uniref:Uncharacterized protein n=1 Tax=Citrus unshiu TaxID=55188 RepID=A0A2H5PXF6_CITUN|nr:hypothetical protein CUMW_176450 [Citrus unshiu]
MQKLKLTKTLEIKFKTNLTNLSIGIDSPETILFSPISPFSLFVAICSCLPPSVEFGSAEVRKNQLHAMAYKDGCVKLHIMASVHSGFCDGSKFLFQGTETAAATGIDTLSVDWKTPGTG